MEANPNENITLNEGLSYEPGVMDRIRNLGDGAVAKLAIKASAFGASLGIGGVVTEMVFSPEANGAEQGCVPKLLQPPHGISAVMSNAGHAHQETLVKGSASAVPGCENLKRIEKYRLQVKKGGHWTNFDGGPYWYLIGSGNEAHEVSGANFAASGIYDECVNGRREPARVQFQNTVKNLNSDKLFGPGKIKSSPVKTPDC